jgi:serine/threonine-protein kinase
MQLVRGPNLWEVAPRLSLEEAVEILAAVALGMHAAHRVNLIHRDLKPSNILLERSPAGGWIPYVADFGLAKDLGEEGFTQTHGVLGTPSFMAPEQKTGDGSLVGPPTDIYALGATLCAVLNLDRRMRASAPKWNPEGPGNGETGPQPSWGSTPRNLRIILQRCLEPRPQDRYPNAGALAEDFRRLLDFEPLLAEHGGWLRRFRRVFRTHPAWAASIGITLLLGLGTTLWSARLTAQGKRRASLAMRFALDAKDLEKSIGIERLHPPHDLGPVLERMTEGLARIQKEMAQLGPEAMGPGNLALGRGYLAMRFLEQARTALEAAWNGGYRTPDVAYALCKTYCDLYIRTLDEEQTEDLPPSLELAARQLDAARTYYELALGATWEPRELCGARILIFERRGAEALALARQLSEKDRWFYEAKVEEAYALDAIGYDEQRAGHYQAALRNYKQAESAALGAQSIGRSDITCYLASMDWRLHWLENPHVPPAQALALWKEAEDLADTVLRIRPGNFRGHSAKLYAILGRARTLKRLGLDPEPDLARAERYLDLAGLTPGYRWAVSRKRELIRRTRGDLGRLS